MQPPDCKPAATPVTEIATFDVIPLAAPGGPSWGVLWTGDLSIHVEQTASSDGDLPEAWLTLWGDPSGGYLSLETWLGKPNSLATGDGLCCLDPGDALVWTVAMTVEQTVP